MDIRKEIQLNRVADEVQALLAVVLPILRATLFALNHAVVKKVGGLDKIDLQLLSRMYKPGDGDCGICFEYAVHEAIINSQASIIERIDDALTKCKIRGERPTSILFGAEKTGAIQLIKSAKEVLTSESKLLTGVVGKPIKLKKHIDGVASAFRSQQARNSLPSSINGLWKADLFVGQQGPDKWVGTTVKINPKQLEHAKGLRLGIVPSKQGKKDKIVFDDVKNLLIVPLPYDGDFVELFYRGFIIVTQFLASDAKMPKEVALPTASDRQVCRILVERRDYPVLDVIEALKPLAQPELLETEVESVSLEFRKGKSSTTSTILAPFSTIK